MDVIVFTGGPCGGKTTTLNALKKECGEKVLIVPEPATMLMSTGFPAPGRDLTYSEMWQYLFQSAISPLQLHMEEAFRLVAEQTGAQLIICDRGILDGAAYYKGGLPAFLAEFGLDEQECYSRYAQVIHLESTATCNPALYGKTGNEARYESLDEAVALEHRTREAWQGHPNWTFMSGEDGIDETIARAISIVSEYVDVEIERKFVLSRFPATQWVSGAKTILQGYLVAEEDELRIRRIGDQMFIASKSQGTLRRSEWERPLPRLVFERMWPQTSGARVFKVRHFVPYGKHALEVDVYEGDLLGLVTMECEFKSREEADKFVLPEWAEDAVEVTEDPAYKNKNLALYGLP